MAVTPAAPSLGVGVLQCEGVAADPEANLAILDAACARCAAAGDGLLVTPELFLSGYNIGADASRLAVPRGGALLARVAATAGRHGVAVCAGFPERRGEVVYNAVVLAGADGSVLGHYRKHRTIGAFEQETFTRGDGTDLVADLHGVRVGVLVCYDAEFPENVRRLALAGVSLVVVPTALSREFAFVAEKMIPTRAFENGVFVAYADHCGEERGKRYAGLSCIVAPDGADLARADGGEALLRARVTPGDYAALADRLPYLRDVATR